MTSIRPVPRRDRPTRAQKPWITPTASERHAGAFMFNGQSVSFPVGTRDAKGRLITEHREFGCLWQPTPEDLGGEVHWREMHTGRQRLAMAEQRCQVCGEKIITSPTLWLIPDVEMRTTKAIRSGRTFETTTPPVCATCLPLALTLCPNLRQDTPTLLEVKHYRLFGVWGDYVEMATQGSRLRQGQLLLGDPAMPRMMARHLVVQVYDYRRKKQ